MEELEPWQDSVGSSSSGKSHGLNNGIRSIKEALHRCVNGNRSLLTRRMVNNNGHEIDLKEVYRSKKRGELAKKKKIMMI